MNKIIIKESNSLINTDWLESHLGAGDLRIFDCTLRLLKDETGCRPYIVEDCRHEHESGHIPGAAYLNLQAEFSTHDSPYAMTLPDPSVVAAAFAQRGVDNNSRVVLYSRNGMAWATRFWWMLKWLGFNHASVLDGGFDKWKAEGRPLSKASPQYPKGTLTLKLQPNMFVGKGEVFAAINDPTILTMSALNEEQYAGRDTKFGRVGRIVGSINVPQKNLVEPSTGAFKTPEEIAQIFERAGAFKAKKIITYCGGGIFATVDAFWLHQLGHENVAVYDNSLSEWASDPSLPMESDVSA